MVSEVLYESIFRENRSKTMQGQRCEHKNLLRKVKDKS